MRRAEIVLDILRENKELKGMPYVNLDEDLMEWICEESINVLKSEETLLKLTAPLNIVGDVHGQFVDLMRYFDMEGMPPNANYLFLGDYVDRGFNSVETIVTLLCLKLLYPQNIWLLRGNHETYEVSEIYGFCEECTKRYSKQLWLRFVDVFDMLPIAAVVNERIFCVHGGLSQHLEHVSQIEYIERPVSIPMSGLLTDLLWADPSSEINGFAPSDRGTSYLFGVDVLQEFVERYDYDLVCRAHQVVMNGFDFPFPDNQGIVTVFSAPNYCYEYGNKGSLLKIDDHLSCSFTILEPIQTPHDNVTYGIDRCASPMYVT